MSFTVWHGKESVNDLIQLLWVGQVGIGKKVGIKKYWEIFWKEKVVECKL